MGWRGGIEKTPSVAKMSLWITLFFIHLGVDICYKLLYTVHINYKEKAYAKYKTSKL